MANPLATESEAAPPVIDPALFDGHRPVTGIEGAKSIGIHPKVLYRWGRDGIALPNGKRLFLRHVRIGRTPLFTLAWIRSFCRERAEAIQQSNGAPRPAKQTKREIAAQNVRQHGDAVEQLEAMGIPCGAAE